MKYTLEQLDVMEGHKFEYAVADLLRHNGFCDVKVTKASNDFGLDILASKNDIKYGIQCKRQNSPVGVAAVSEAVSGTAYYHMDKAVVITNNGYTNQAIKLAKSIGVSLLGRAYLKQLIDNYDVDNNKNIIQILKDVFSSKTTKFILVILIIIVYIFYKKTYEKSLTAENTYVTANDPESGTTAPVYPNTTLEDILSNNPPRINDPFVYAKEFNRLYGTDIVHYNYGNSSSEDKIGSVIIPLDGEKTIDESMQITKVFMPMDLISTHYEIEYERKIMDTIEPFTTLDYEIYIVKRSEYESMEGVPYSFQIFLHYNPVTCSISRITINNFYHIEKLSINGKQAVDWESHFFEV